MSVDTDNLDLMVGHDPPEIPFASGAFPASPGSIVEFPKGQFDGLLGPVVDWANSIEFPNEGERESWERKLFDFDARIKWLRSKQSNNQTEGPAESGPSNPIKTHE